MLPWCYLVGNVLQWEAKASSLPMGEQREEEDGVGSMSFCMEEEGFSNFTNTSTHKLKQNLTGMHAASRQMHTHVQEIHTHTLSIQQN